MPGINLHSNCDVGAFNTLLEIIRSGSHSKQLSWHLISSLFRATANTFKKNFKRDGDLKERP